MLTRLLTLLVLVRLGRGRRLPPPLAPGAPPPAGGVSVVVPARDEEHRIAGALEPLRDDDAVSEVIVVDDESRDATAQVAASLGARVVTGAPLPEGWAGKAWALQQGLREATAEWVVFLDADTRPKRGLVAALVEAAVPYDLVCAGPRFVCDTNAERFVHASMLASLVYRFGPQGPGGKQPRPPRTVFNGQCIAVRREELVAAGGWTVARGSLVEDVALARVWRRAGARLSFFDAADLLEVRMYGSAREAWEGWGRSVMAPGETKRRWQLLDLLTIWLVMALPLVRRQWGLVALRLLVTAALARSYRPRGPGFWLSPLADLPVAVRLTRSVLRPARSWRGRTYSARPRRTR